MYVNIPKINDDFERSTNDQRRSSIPEFGGSVEKNLASQKIPQPVKLIIKHIPGRSQAIREDTNENMIETEVILELVKLITLVLQLIETWLRKM